MRLRTGWAFLVVAGFAGCAEAPGIRPPSDAGTTHDSGDDASTCGAAGEPCCETACHPPLACTSGVCGFVSDMDGSGDGGCPFTLCHEVCTDVDSDPLNCGICGHDCQGTLCSSGLCLGQGIAMGTSPVELVVDSTYLYFTDANGTVNAVPSGGGTLAVLASGIPSPYGIAVDGKSVYFTSEGTGAGDGAVLKVPIGPGGGPPDGGSADAAPVTPIVIASGRNSPQALVVDDARVYWLEPGTAPTNGALLACPLTGCPSNTPQVLVDSMALPYGLVLDSTSLYVTASGGGQVLGIDKSTAAIRVLAQMQNQPEGITIANGMAYWATNLDGLVQAVPVVGDAGTRFIVATMGAPQSVAADGVNVYWSDTSPVGTFGPVEACSVTGCPPATSMMLVGTDETATNIAIDALFVYWIDGNGQILRVAK